MKDWYLRSRSKAWRVHRGINPASRCAFPRISRLRWDKPPVEADRLETLERMLKSETEPAPGEETIIPRTAARKPSRKATHKAAH